VDGIGGARTGEMVSERKGVGLIYWDCFGINLIIYGQIPLSSEV
jgi:hypothetical protein